MSKPRQEVEQEDQWNVAVLYPSIEAWEEAFNSAEGSSKDHSWPMLQAFKGSLGESSHRLREALDTLFATSRTLELLYTYAHLRHDEDITNEKAKAAYQRILHTLHDFQKEISWFEPELLALPEKSCRDYLAAEELATYHFYLEKIFRMRPHTLTADKEALLALASKALQTPHKAFSALNNADFKFGSIVNDKGESCELTHATYGLYQRSHDRTLRKNAFFTLHHKYRDFENTLAELLAGVVQGHIVQAEARGYSSCLEAALFPNNIDVAVYHSLIHTVRDNLDALHSYVELRERVLKVDGLHLYDLYVPLIDEVDIKMDYLKAQDQVVAAVAPLGSEYQEMLRRGLVEERWVDRYENQNKRSGAYSSGCYDSYPYILMNYKSSLRDVFTLAHEAGHSMHSKLSHTHQPYHYGDYSIFVAEVASTFNEQLLSRLLLEKAESRAEKIFLINEKIEELRTTLFRQVMFAEFELLIHRAAEERQPLTPQFLKEQYRALNSAYFGPRVILDAEVDLEWSRIPHFYYNFYVYQYATGISAALALSDRVLLGGERERQDYLQFLQSGNSAYPIDLLASAGVDMRSGDAVKAAIAHFRALVKELEELLK